MGNNLMVVQVFIQNEAGSNRKNYHDERTLEYLETRLVSKPYPFPYGFLVSTLAADGCCVDCFVITSRPLRSGDIVDCEVIGLMEQVEDGLPDHNVLARPVGERSEVNAAVEASLADFVSHVFDHVVGKQIRVGRFLEADAGWEHVKVSRKDSLNSQHRIPKVLAYITREGAAGTEILVFERKDQTEAAGVEVPGGTLESGETLVAALWREIEEETGLTDLRLVSQVANAVFHADWRDEWQERNVFHVEAGPGLPDRWTHVVTSGHDDKGLQFECSWLPVTTASQRLRWGQGEWLVLLGR